ALQPAVRIPVEAAVVERALRDQRVRGLHQQCAAGAQDEERLAHDPPRDRVRAEQARVARRVAQGHGTARVRKGTREDLREQLGAGKGAHQVESTAPRPDRSRGRYHRDPCPASTASSVPSSWWPIPTTAISAARRPRRAGPTRAWPSRTASSRTETPGAPT